MYLNKKLKKHDKATKTRIWTCKIALYPVLDSLVYFLWITVKYWFPPLYKLYNPNHGILIGKVITKIYVKHMNNIYIYK